MEFRNLALGVLTLWPLAWAAWRSAGGGADAAPYCAPSGDRSERMCAADEDAPAYGSHASELFAINDFLRGRPEPVSGESEGLRWRSDNSFSRFYGARPETGEPGAVDNRPRLRIRDFIDSLSASLESAPAVTRDEDVAEPEGQAQIRALQRIQKALFEGRLAEVIHGEENPE